MLFLPPYLRHLVPLEDEGDAGAAVVQVAAVGFTLGLRRSRGVGARAHPPVAAGRREAAEETVLHALVATGTRRGRSLAGRGRGSGQEAGPTAAPHLAGQTSTSLMFPDSRRPLPAVRERR